jgi:glutamate/tyrosine decarboxylase-like PLP-dependent enzyme
MGGQASVGGNEPSPLALDGELMRRLGYRTVDLLVERLTGPSGPVVRTASPEELRERLAIAPPETPTSFEEILSGLEQDVLPFVARISHPGYLAFIPGEGTWPGALGDLIASALNIDTCWWLGASGPSALELVVLDWFKEWVGYPQGAGGVLVSGGSAANLTAIACAREARVGAMDERIVIYMSDQTHSSVARAARALGFRPDQVRIIPSDREARIRVDALRGAIDADRKANREPLAVIANAGSTAAGAVDPLESLAALCRDEQVWFHVDGAYGAFACLTGRGRAALEGLALADSITLDPHKWLYQPVEVGALLVRDGAAMRRGFEIIPEFLADIEAGAREVNFSDLGLQLTRTSRALKLWMSIRYFGLAAFRSSIDRCLDLALKAQARIEASNELELLSPASLGILMFRRHPPGVEDEATLERINAEIVEQVERGGEVFVSTGRIHGRYAIRLCILNHSTSWTEVEHALELAETIEVDVDSAPSQPVADGYRALDEGWLGRSSLEADGLRAIKVFASLGDEDAARVLRVAREQDALPGEAVVEQWEVSRDMYVVLSGSVDVIVDGRAVRSLGPGEFFGEVAAIDWGAGFGRTRTATVVSTGHTRLLALDWVLVNELMASDPVFAAVLESTSRTRIASG